MIPEHIQKEINENSELDWIEGHDILECDNDNPFDQKNQFDWWRKNVDIRKAFKEIEKEIEGLKKKNNKINKRVVSWTKIAKLAKCDRNTLRHPKREKWTQERFDFINNLLNNNDVHSSNKSEQINSTEVLEEKLLKSRNEAAKWMDKFLVLEVENKTLKRALKHKDHEIFTKSRKIKELVDKINKLED